MLCLTPALSNAQQGERCKNVLENAEETFDAGGYDGVIDQLEWALENCKSSFAEDRQKIRAYELIALAYLKKKRRGKVREWTRRILQVDPNYRPAAELFQAGYADLVEQSRVQLQSEKPNKLKRWLIGGAGLLAGGTVVFLILNRNEIGLLPTPPDPPDGFK